MKRYLALALLFGLVLAQEGPTITGNFSFGLGLRYTDLALAQNEARCTLRLETGLEDAALVAELDATPKGIGLGEAYAEVYLGAFDLAAGRILENTGRTDLFSPLDAFNPRDLARPIAEPEDQKVPLEALRVAYYPEDADAEIRLLYAPVFVPSTPPAGWRGRRPGRRGAGSRRPHPRGSRRPGAPRGAPFGPRARRLAGRGLSG